MRVSVGWRVGVWSRQWSVNGNSGNGSMCVHVVVITHFWGLQAKYNMNPEVKARICNCTVLKSRGSGLWLIRILHHGSRNNLALKVYWGNCFCFNWHPQHPVVIQQIYAILEQLWKRRLLLRIQLTFYKVLVMSCWKMAEDGVLNSLAFNLQPLLAAGQNRP